MPDTTSAEDTVIRIAALKAAKDAADHMVKTSAPKAQSSVGAFALYTWGALALVSAVYATVLGVNLEELTFQAPQIAQVEKPATSPVLTDAEPKGAPEVVKLAEVEQTDEISAFESPLPPELSNLPEPLAPRVELPKDHLASLKEETPTDDLQTGSVNALDEFDLQPFPDDVVPENLFAVDIGGAKAIAPLIGRYSALKRRAPDLFSDLEPRIQLKDTDNSLEARLVAGPFTSRDQVAQFCRSLRLRLTVDCAMTSFEGDTIQ